jgi:hypothetical protein
LLRASHTPLLLVLALRRLRPEPFSFSKPRSPSPSTFTLAPPTPSTFTLAPPTQALALPPLPPPPPKNKLQERRGMATSSSPGSAASPGVRLRGDLSYEPWLHVGLDHGSLGALRRAVVHAVAHALPTANRALGGARRTSQCLAASQPLSVCASAPPPAHSCRPLG